MTGAEIRAFRQQAGLTQEKLGATIGVSTSTVHCWEKEKQTPAPERIKQLEELMKSGVRPPAKEAAKPVEPVKPAKPAATKTANPCKACPYWQHMDRAKSKTMYCACLQETGHVRTCGVERTYQRHRALSPLSLDAARAAELGVSYGAYKAGGVI